jgi:ADP-ribose pyrophosphatase YjhB (NUDIX family)
MSNIRATALGCFIRSGNELLVVHGNDSVKREAFYRFPGGGIEFGETGEVALHREIHEELQQTIRIVRHLGYLENLFVYAGKPHHEIEQVFLAEFIDTTTYERRIFEVTENYEGHQNPIATWVPLSEFRSGEKILHPTGVLAMIDGAMPASHSTPELQAPVLLRDEVARHLMEACAEQGARKFLVDHLIENAELLDGGCFEFKGDDVNRYVLSPAASLAVGNDRYPETSHYHTIKTEIYVGGFHSFAIWKLGQPETAIVRGDFDGIVIIPPRWCHLMKPKPVLTWTMQIPNPVGSDKREVDVPQDIAACMQ